MENSPSYLIIPQLVLRSSTVIWNLEVYYRIHKSPRTVHILRQSNAVHAPQPTSSSSILILVLSSHLGLGLPISLFSSGFPTKLLYAPLVSPILVTRNTHLILLDFITRRVLFWALCTIYKRTKQKTMTNRNEEIALIKTGDKQVHMRFLNRLPKKIQIKLNIKGYVQQWRQEKMGLLHVR